MAIEVLKMEIVNICVVCVYTHEFNKYSIAQLLEYRQLFYAFAGGLSIL